MSSYGSGPYGGGPYGRGVAATFMRFFRMWRRRFRH